MDRHVIILSARTSRYTFSLPSLQGLILRLKEQSSVDVPSRMYYTLPSTIGGSTTWPLLCSSISVNFAGAREIEQDATQGHLPEHSAHLSLIAVHMSNPCCPAHWSDWDMHNTADRTSLVVGRSPPSPPAGFFQYCA